MRPVADWPAASVVHTTSTHSRNACCCRYLARALQPRYSAGTWLSYLAFFLDSPFFSLSFPLFYFPGTTLFPSPELLPLPPNAPRSPCSQPQQSPADPRRDSHLAFPRPSLTPAKASSLSLSSCFSLRPSSFFFAAPSHFVHILIPEHPPAHAPPTRHPPPFATRSYRDPRHTHHPRLPSPPPTPTPPPTHTVASHRRISCRGAPSPYNRIASAAPSSRLGKELWLLPCPRPRPRLPSQSLSRGRPQQTSSLISTGKLPPSFVFHHHHCLPVRHAPSRAAVYRAQC